MLLIISYIIKAFKLTLYLIHWNILCTVTCVRHLKTLFLKLFWNILLVFYEKPTNFADTSCYKNIYHYDKYMCMYVLFSIMQIWLTQILYFPVQPAFPTPVFLSKPSWTGCVVSHQSFDDYSDIRVKHYHLWVLKNISCFVIC